MNLAADNSRCCCKIHVSFSYTSAQSERSFEDCCENYAVSSGVRLRHVYVCYIFQTFKVFAQFLISVTEKPSKHLVKGCGV
jgi:hypothetical protein